MVSEAKRGLARIVSNYARLISTITLGIVLVPLLLEVLGDEGWSLYALLGSTVGLASVAQGIVRASLVRELGSAYHGDDPDHFVTVYNSALLISLGMGVVSVILFAVLWVVVPVLEIPEHLIPAARWVIVAVGAETFVVLLLAAPFNMYRVTERMAAYNGWLVLQRLCYVTAAVTLLIRRVEDTGLAVKTYALISSSLFPAVTIVAVIIMALMDRRMIPKPTTIRWSAVTSVLHVSGWNAAAITSLLLHRRLAPILMNVVFGLGGNLIIGIAIQLTMSVRRLSYGMTEGVDAVAARLSTVKGNQAVREFMHHSTRLHGFATFPGAVIIWILAAPLITVWLAKRLDNPAETVPDVVVIIRIMAFGMAARAISDGWIGILYGAGHVRRYAPLMIAGAFLNPLIWLLLLSALPTELRYTAVPLAYSIVLVVVHAGLVPIVGARAMGLAYRDFFVPLIRPCIAALVSSPILLLAMGSIDRWTLWKLFLVVAIYGIVYVALCVTFVMDPPERERFTKAALRRLAGRR